MNKTSVVTFDQAGNFMLDHTGFVGTQCEEATKALVGNLGGTVKRDVKKPEYSQRASGSSKLTQRW